MDGDRQPHHQLALIEDSTGIIPGSKPCSAGLWKLLAEAEDAGGAYRLIALNKTLRAECESVLPALTGALYRDPDPQRHSMDLMAVLIRHAPALGVTAKSDGEWASYFGVYLDTLEPLSVAALEAAFDGWHHAKMYPDQPGRHAFYPRPAELFHLGNAFRLELAKAAYRGKRALEHVEKKGVEWTAERKAEEKRKAIEMGYLNPDGTFKAVVREVPRASEFPKPRHSPHELAERLRASAPVHDVGDVV